MKKINIAVDGFSSCGKSTIAKGLAKKLDYTYIDSGAMYRAVALHAIRNGWITETEIDEMSLQQGISDIKIAFKTNNLRHQETYLNGENVEKKIRTLEVANGASRVSAIGFVRKELVRQQQEMGRKKGVVMDGRDIGTVVFPDAELKIFLTALPEVRAKRRFDEMTAKGENLLFEEVLANVKERDERDTTRAESPLYKADDAIELDNSEFTVEEQLQFVVDLLIRLFDDLTNNQINESTTIYD
jgi:cytidylate kinase